MRRIDRSQRESFRRTDLATASRADGGASVAASWRPRPPRSSLRWPPLGGGRARRPAPPPAAIGRAAARWPARREPGARTRPARRRTPRPSRRRSWRRAGPAAGGDPATAAQLAATRCRRQQGDQDGRPVRRADCRAGTGHRRRPPRDSARPTPPRGAPPIDQATASVRGIATAAGGFQSRRRRRRARSMTISLRVPADQYDAVIDKLAALGEVTNRTESSQDVTAEIVDVNSRVESMTASVARVRALLAQATDIADVISIESELAAREAESRVAATAAGLPHRAGGDVDRSPSSLTAVTDGAATVEPVDRRTRLHGRPDRRLGGAARLPRLDRRGDRRAAAVPAAVRRGRRCSSGGWCAAPAGRRAAPRRTEPGPTGRRAAPAPTGAAVAPTTPPSAATGDG